MVIHGGEHVFLVWSCAVLREINLPDFSPTKANERSQACPLLMLLIQKHSRTVDSELWRCLTQWCKLRLRRTIYSLIWPANAVRQWSASIFSPVDLLRDHRTGGLLHRSLNFLFGQAVSPVWVSLRVAQFWTPSPKMYWWYRIRWSDPWSGGSNGISDINPPFSVVSPHSIPTTSLWD